MTAHIIIAYLLSHARPSKAAARDFLISHLGGHRESQALGEFDAAWNRALSATPHKSVLSLHAGDEFAHACVSLDKGS